MSCFTFASFAWHGFFSPTLLGVSRALFALFFPGRIFLPLLWRLSQLVDSWTLPL
ncbi:hypothetical protein C8R48DRAFT_726375 [Suillus tomentosus]|nr:hypothetical protein C8R48DRAFT_726375 [Suillus tomentosus]